MRDQLPSMPSATSRRDFLRALGLAGLASALPSCRRSSATSGQISRSEAPDLITSAEQSLNVFDLEAVARSRLPPAHFGYLATGIDGDRTVTANRDAFDHWYLRPRRLVDVSSIDTSVQLFGVRWPTPIILAPVGSQRAFHPEAEVASARAARAGNHLQILSTVASASIEEVIAARGGPVWHQLYPTTRWDVTEKVVRRALSAGASAIVVTVDYPASPNRETQYRAARSDARDCHQCHADPPGDVTRKPMYAETGIVQDQFRAANLTWASIDRLRTIANVPILVKGILTREDAAACLKHQVDGIIVSNHGGRALETGRGALDCLPGVVAAIRQQVPVLVDGGFRRGTDIFKALALGADAVCVGRPYIWGLAAFGEAGAARSLFHLRTELDTVMKLCGTTSCAALGPTMIGAV